MFWNNISHLLTVGVLSVCLLTPTYVFAAIVINEVVWMGTSVSANDEWIELYNSGSESVSVDGWALSDEGSLTITLAGTIGAGEYAVLERTDDDSAPGTAFLIYTGALNNSGATLVLRDEASAIQDQVAGGENWENIGGDNTTKETPQLTDGGWVTAVATPGAASPGGGSSESEGSGEEENDDSSGGGGGSSSDDDGEKEEKKTNNPSLSVSAPKTGYLMQPLTLSVAPSDMGEIYKNTMAYTWNFGDGTIGTGGEVTHRWWFPGTYMVAVRGFAHDMELVEKVKITILPAQISLERSEEGDLRIHSNSALESNLSGFMLRSQGRQFTIPNDTYLTPRGTLTLRLSVLGMTEANTFTLLDQAGRTIAVYPESVEMNVPFIEVEAPVSKTAVPESLAVGEGETNVALVTSSDTEAGESGGESPRKELIYALLVGLIALATFSLYARNV